MIKVKAELAKTNLFKSELNLLWLELKRIFTEFNIIALLLICFCLNLLLLYVDLKADFTLDILSISRGRYNELVASFTGEPSEAKARMVANQLQEVEKAKKHGLFEYKDDVGNSHYILEDELILNNIKDNMTYTYFYNSELENLLQIADEMPNGDFYRQVYGQRYIPRFSKNDGLGPFLLYKNSSWLLILFFLYVLAPLFWEDSCRLRSIQYRQGAALRRNVSSVVRSSLFMLALLVALFRMQDLLFYHYNLGIGNLTNPLYASKIFAYTPFKGSLGLFLICDYIAKFLGLAVFILCFIFFSLICERKYVSSILAMILIITLMFDDTGARSMLNPLCLLHIASELRTAEPLYLFGRNFVKSYVSLCLPLLTLILVFNIIRWGVKHVQCRNQKV